MEVLLVFAAMIGFAWVAGKSNVNDSHRMRHLKSLQGQVRGMHSIANINSHQVARLHKHRVPRRFRDDHVSQLWDEAFTLLCERKINGQ